MSNVPYLTPRTELVTPEIAEAWLQKQFGGQRNMRDHHVILLAGEMERGTFVPHNAITFAVVGEDRYLIDGQHRLNAVIKYGKPVPMPILDIPANSKDEVRRLYGNIDQGLRRSATDAIRAMGLADEFGLAERRVQRMSGALRAVATRFTDITAGGSRAESRKQRILTRSNAVNTTLLRAWKDEIHRYYEIVEGGEPSVVAMFERAAVLGCALLTIRYAPVEAEDFWSEAARDDGLSANDPRKRFIVWLREEKKPKSSEIARAFAVCWRNYLRGSELKLIRINTRTLLELEKINLDAVEAEIQRLIANIDDRQPDLLAYGEE
jgi:hypothetical protein